LVPNRYYGLGHAAGVGNALGILWNEKPIVFPLQPVHPYGPIQFQPAEQFSFFLDRAFSDVGTNLLTSI
jgi:hypothetical protein